MSLTDVIQWIVIAALAGWLLAITFDIWDRED